MTEDHRGSCVVCQRRDPRQPFVCDGDRAYGLTLLDDIAELCDTDDPAMYVLRDRRPHLDKDGKPTGKAADPVALAVPSGPLSPQQSGPRVSGTSGHSEPGNLVLVDLLAPARQGSRGPNARGILGDDDQDGVLSVATILDTWVRDWRDTVWTDHSLPDPTIPTMVKWLRNRLDVACDTHPAIDEWFDDMKALRFALRHALGRTGSVVKLDPPCPTCDMKGLYREYGADYVRCGTCGRLWTEDEYQRLCVVLAGEHTGEVA